LAAAASVRPPPPAFMPMFTLIVKLLLKLVQVQCLCFWRCSHHLMRMSASRRCGLSATSLVQKKLLIITLCLLQWFHS